MKNIIAEYVYILRIAGELLNENDHFIVVTESQNLAINIALTKLVCAKVYLKEYTCYCGERAEEFPALAPLSYNDWLADAIIKDRLNGITITEKPLITYDNVGDLVL